MIAYNPKDWFSFLFKMHKADTFHHLFLMIFCICIYSCLIAWFELEYLNLSKKTWVKEIHLFHGLLGFVLSLLLVFRTNTAYDRWWEGRKIWGNLVNASRNIALKINAYLPENDQHKKYFEKIIPLYAKALAAHLTKETIRLELDDSTTNVLSIDKKKHIPNQIALQILKKVQYLYNQKLLTDAQFININVEITTLTDVCGACERIKNTPIPFSYSLFIKKFIFIYVMTLPFGFVFKLGYYIIPVVAIVFYVLASLELIAEEIEDPFGTDVNDVPMQKIAANIEKAFKKYCKICFIQYFELCK